jgi:cardiolipin synthase A/B
MARIEPPTVFPPAWMAGQRPFAHGMAIASLAAAAACSTLPNIVPDMATDARRPVSLAGAHGPLAAPTSRTLLARLERGGEATGIFDRHLAREEAIVGSPMVVGNTVTLLKDGPITFAHMFAAIEGARRRIDMETYIIEDDAVGNRFADALIRKRNEGVAVNLIYDSVGSIDTPGAFFGRLVDAGIAVLEFNPVNPVTAGKHWDLDHRDHRKLLIVDGSTAFLGGINISSVYSGGSARRRASSQPTGSLPWRDTHVKIEGPVVAEFHKLFVATWHKQGGEPLRAGTPVASTGRAGSDVVRAIGSSPDEPFSLIYATLISAIGSAETSIHLTNAYFVPDPQLLAALEAAVRRGVDVRIILPSATDSALVFHAGRSYYTELLRAGITILERRDTLLHAKTAVIDGVWSTVGSTNLDWRSFLHNDEVNAVILGQGFAAQMEAMFAADEAASTAITLDRWETRSVTTRIKEWFSRLWAYWL